MYYSKLFLIYLLCVLALLYVIPYYIFNSAILILYGNSSILNFINMILSLYCSLILFSCYIRKFTDISNVTFMINEYNNIQNDIIIQNDNIIENIIDDNNIIDNIIDNIIENDDGIENEYGFAKIRYENGDIHMKMSNEEWLYYNKKKDITYIQNWNYEILTRSKLHKKHNYIDFPSKIEVVNKELFSEEECNKLICPISREFMIYPVKLECGHVFDKIHIMTLMNKTINNICPLCRNQILNYDYYNELIPLLKRCEYKYVDYDDNNNIIDENINMNDINNYFEFFYFE